MHRPSLPLTLLVFSSIIIATSGVGVAAERLPVPLASLATRCIAFQNLKIGPGVADVAECQVTDFRAIGKMGNQTYYYALYCLTPNDSVAEEKCDARMKSSPWYRTDGVAIFVQDGQASRMRIMYDPGDIEIGMFNYGKPEIIKNQIGTFLLVPIQLTGTGHGNASQVYFWDGRTWRPLDTQAWLTDLRARLPRDREIRKGVWPDFRTLKTNVPLYKREDPNASPSGGTALIELAVTGNKLSIKSVAFAKEQVDTVIIESAFRRFPDPVNENPRPMAKPPAPNFPSLDQPLKISSWHGNGFGVVGELTGRYRLEGDKLTVQAETIKLRQAFRCTKSCVTVKQIGVGLYGPSDASHFSGTAESAPLPVGKTFAESAPMTLEPHVFEMKLPSNIDLSKLWLGMSIENTEGGTYYTHTERNFFARALHAQGLSGDPCQQVKGLEQAIETRCNDVLSRELSHWYRPVIAWWDRWRGVPQPIFVASRENNLNAIRILAAHGTDVDTPNRTGETPLMLAVANGRVEMVQALLQAGANVNYSIDIDNEQRGRTALNSALFSSSAETIKLLLAAGAKTDKPDRYGWLPVHYAAYYDNATGLDMLKAHQANLEAVTTSSRGETPLMIAAQYGKNRAIRSLLALSVDPKIKDLHDKAAYDYAVFFKQESAAEILKPR